MGILTIELVAWIQFGNHRSYLSHTNKETSDLSWLPCIVAGFELAARLGLNIGGGKSSCQIFPANYSD
jgi:hypothetical protein